MNEMANVQPYGLQKMTIEDLGVRTAAIVQDINFSANRLMEGMVSLGEVLVCVKEKTDFGRYGNYGKFLKDNGLSERMAQQSIQVYRRFAQRPEVLKQLGTVSKLKEVLALPEECEDQFFEENNVAQMNTRELRKKVQEVRQDAGYTKPHESEPKTEDSDQMQALKTELEKVKRQLSQEQKSHQSDTVRMDRLKNLLDISAKKREELDNEVIRLKRQSGREKPAETEGVRTADAFQAAVRKLMSDFCEVPHMGREFDAMSMDERGLFVRSLDLLEDFSRDIRRALEDDNGEEAYVK